jgi:hypothetical protein
MKKSDSALSNDLSTRLCMLAHDLNNGLAVIAGHCELLTEHVEADSECRNRLRLINEMAHSLAKKINGHECQLTGALNSSRFLLETAAEPVPTFTQPQSVNGTAAKDSRALKS